MNHNPEHSLLLSPKFHTSLHLLPFVIIFRCNAARSLTHPRCRIPTCIPCSAGRNSDRLLLSLALFRIGRLYIRLIVAIPAVHYDDSYITFKSISTRRSPGQVKHGQVSNMDTSRSHNDRGHCSANNKSNCIPQGRFRRPVHTTCHCRLHGNAMKTATKT